MNIIKDFRNDLLKRKEIKVVVPFEKNPGLEKAAEIISENFNVNKEVIAIKALKSKFGRDTFLIESFIYDSVKDMERVEPKLKVKKGAKA